MKILHVLTSPRAEGTPSLVLDWLSVKEHEQHVLFLNDSPKDLLISFQEKNKNIHLNPYVKNKLFNRIKRIPIIVKRKCREIKPDLVVAWNQPNIHLILAGAKIAGVKKLIGHAGCLPEKSTKTGWLYTYFVFYPILMLGAKVVCPSKHIYNTFLKIPFFPKSTLEVVPNAINIDRFLKKEPAEAKKQSAIFVANLEEAKDHETLIEAWKLVLQELPDATLKFAGRGSLEKKLKDLCISLNCDKSIEFLGARNDVPQLLWQSELFIFPSKNVEGFGTVLIEALAAGLKIVSFDEPAPREVLENGKYGLLVKERTPIALARGIIDAFVNNNSVKDTKEYISKFSVENMVKKYIEVTNG